MERVLIVVAEIGVSRNKLVVRRRAATQRLLTVTKGSFPASHLCEFGFDCVATRYRPKRQHRVS